MSKVKSSLLTYLSYLSYLVTLNLQFMLLLILGFGIFGIAPAISAIIPILHDFRCGHQVHRFSDFFSNYKKGWFKSNLIFIFYLLTVAIILLNIRISILYFSDFIILKVVYLLALAISSLTCLLMLCHLTKNARLNLQENFRLTCFVLIRFPFQSISLIFALSFAGVILTLKSGIFLFAGFSSLLFILEFFQATLIDKLKKLTNEWG